MECRRIKKKLSSYLDEEISQREREDIALHLNSCLDCAREMKALSDMCLLLREDSGVEPSQDFLVQLFERIKGKDKRYSLAGRKNWSFTPFPVLVRMVVLLVLGIFIGAGLGALTSPGRQAAIELRTSRNLAIEADLQNFQSVYPRSLTQAYLNQSSTFKS